jgi:hypothetical protein
MTTEYFIWKQHNIHSSQQPHGTFSKTDRISGHKASLNKHKETEITPCILSDHNAVKLELNNKSSSRKHTNNWRLKTHCSTISGSEKK